MITQIVLGIDIGGTNADFAFIDREGIILYKANLPSDEYNTANSFVQLVKRMAEEAMTKLKKQLVIRGIGIGAPNGN